MIDFPASAETLLRTWAEFCVLGKAKAVFAQIETASRTQGSTGVDETFRTMLHVERFFSDPEHQCFREIALQAFGRLAMPSLVLCAGHWHWWRPGETKSQATVRHGWGWVTNWQDPLHDVWRVFKLKFGGWHAGNPMPALGRWVDETIGDQPLTGEDLDKRLISVSTAVVCLRSCGKDVTERWIRELCENKRLAGACKPGGGEWAIPLGSVRQLAKPRRGQPRKRKRGRPKEIAA